MPVICDVNLERARKRRDQFYPAADICDDYQQVVRRKDIEVIDAALHPEHRIPLMKAALSAGKHVLSREAIRAGYSNLAERLADLADGKRGVKLRE